ncbi:MAG: TSUP family transporter [Pyrinomonadaceae bacterium]
MPDKKSALRFVFPVWIACVYAAWLAVILSGPGFAIFKSHWMYSVMMIFGASVAGYTPEGGGAVAYPILSLYFKITPPVARDFSLAIQAVGMVSAGIYIVFGKGRDLSFFRHIPLFLLFNFIGFAGVSHFQVGLPFPVFQMIFVSMALAFIASFWITRTFGTEDNFSPDSSRRLVATAVFCMLGGAASAMFGTGSDMLLYILLSVYFGVKEKSGTDLSIVLMGLMSLAGILYRIFVFGDVNPEVFSMWIVAVPVVTVFAPFGNMLMKTFRKERMLVFVLLMNGFNFIYWGIRNPAMVLYGLLVLAAFVVLFSGSFWFRKRSA